jgi:uncharacterized protein (TIGR00251 family)
VIPLSSSASGTSFAVRVVPRAGRTAAAGVRGDALVVRLAAAPVDGAANDALIEFLSDAIACPKRDIAIVSGARSRDKVVRVSGVSADTIALKLLAILDT